jgi:CDP-diacylglycerol--glycerol-3-phosphate 3-phosphatidyltransferase
MNIPNSLTILRIVLAFVFVGLVTADGVWMKTSALLVFLLAGFTDYWDGKIARRSGQITRFGKLMDPIADKLLTLSAFFAFLLMGLISAWMVGLVVFRDIFITVFRLLMPAKSSDAQAAENSGKNKTAFQFIFIGVSLIYLIAAETSGWNHDWDGGLIRIIRAGMTLVVAMTLWSGAQYVWHNRRVFDKA